MRGWTHLKGRGDKLAVRPLLVDEFYIHFLRSARPGFTVVPATVPVAQVLVVPHLSLVSAEPALAGQPLCSCLPQSQ